MQIKQIRDYCACIRSEMCQQQIVAALVEFTYLQIFFGDKYVNPSVAAFLLMHSFTRLRRPVR